MSQDHKQSVLIVDDAPEDVLVLQTVLAKRGYRIQTAASGPETFQAVEQEAQPYFHLLEELQTAALQDIL